MDLDADVPPDEIRSLVSHSWDQVAATLTRKQMQELVVLTAEGNAGD